MILDWRAPLESASTGKRLARYLFVARVTATDAVSGTRLEGRTPDLSEGGGCVLTRRGPFSPGTGVLLEIAKNDVSLRTGATVVYNLKDPILGLCFAELPPDQAIL